MRGCSNTGVAMITASTSEASSFSKFWYASGFSALIFWMPAAIFSSKMSHRAVIRARGSALTKVASYVPRLPTPISPTEIFELA